MPPFAGCVVFGRKRSHDGGENQEALRRQPHDIPCLSLRRSLGQGRGPANPGLLIDAIFRDRIRCVYDFSTAMRRWNANQ